MCEQEQIIDFGDATEAGLGTLTYIGRRLISPTAAFWGPIISKTIPNRSDTYPK